MNLPRAIKACRLARGMSQQDLAERVEMSPSYLSLLESGRKEPSLAMLRELAAGLDLSLDVLMLTAIDYGELRKRHAEMSELFGQFLVALVSDASE